MPSWNRVWPQLVAYIVALLIWSLVLFFILSELHIIVFNVEGFSVSALFSFVSSYIINEVRNFILYREPRDKFQYYLRKLNSFSLQADEIILDTSFTFRENVSYEEVRNVFKKLTGSNELKEIFELKNIDIEKLYPDVDGLKLEGKIKGFSFKGNIAIIGEEKINLVEKLQISLVAKSVKYKDLQGVLNTFWYVIDGGEMDLFTLLLREHLPIDPPKGERVIVSVKNKPVALQYFSTLNIDKISAQKTIGKMIYNITILYNHNTKLGELHVEGPWGEIGKIVSEASLWYL